jgi:hypothetical protein
MSRAQASVERRFFSCLYPFNKDTAVFVIPQSEQFTSVSSLSHFDISVFALFRGFVALALVPPGTEPSSLLMYLSGMPSRPLFQMPSVLIWFGLVGVEIRQSHVSRHFTVEDGAQLCWYYCPVSALPDGLIAYFGASIALNFTI